MRSFIIVAFALGSVFARPVDADTIWAIDQHDMLFSFDTANPSIILNADLIDSDFPGDAVAIDFRPSDQRLYMLNAGNRLETVSLIAPPNQPGYPTGDAGPVTGLAGTSHGFDFDPVLDRVRIVSDTDLNLFKSISPSATVAETVLTAPYGNPAIVGAAYSNNFDGATSTTLYTIDAGSDTLNIQNPASGGVQTVVGQLGIDVRSEEVGFDIAQSGVAYLVANPAGQRDSHLYTVNLSTGQATLVGLIGQGVLVRDISVFIVPEPASILLCLGGVSLLRRR